MTIAPAAIPRSDPNGSAGPLVDGTSGVDGVNAADVDDVDGAGHSHAAAATAASEVVPVAVRLIVPLAGGSCRARSSAGETVDCRGGMQTGDGSASDGATPAAAAPRLRSCCPLRTGIETSVRPAAAQSQSSAGNTRQQIKAVNRTSRRSAARPPNRRATNQAAIEASATPKATVSRKSRHRSPG